jgi:hypothetical protein
MGQQPPKTREERRRARRRTIRRRRLAVPAGGMALVAVVLLLVTTVFPGSPQTQGRSGRSHVTVGRVHTLGASARAPERLPVGPATFLGSDGVESRAIIAENRKPGTTAWKITNAAKTGMIEGFADRNYVADGHSFGLYVSTTAPSFRVVAYRMGYYQGKGGREVWSSRQVPGRHQPTCPVDHATNMVSCDNWSRTMTVHVTANWPPGDYVLKLTGSGNQQAYVLLTVWDTKSHATYLLVNRTRTEEG